MEHDLEALRSTAEEVRIFLEPHWARRRVGHSADEEPLSADMCRLSAAFLKIILDERFPDGDWEIVGGEPNESEDIDRNVGLPGGILGVDGRWHGHYWIVDGDYSIVVDVTADQFGGPSVVCGTEDDGYRENYTQWAVEDHVAAVRWTMIELSDDWSRRTALLT